MMMTFDPRNWQLLSRERLHGDWMTAAETNIIYRRAPNQALSSWAKTELALMQRKVAHALDSLSHDDPLIRASAIFLLRDYWPITEATASVVAETLLSDRDAMVRGVTFDSLLRFYGWLPDPNGTLHDLLTVNSEFREHKQIITNITKDLAIIIKKRRSEWVGSIGTLVHEMLGDLTLVEQCLQSGDPQIRYISLLIMALEMQPSPFVALKAREAVCSRLEPIAVRKVAVDVLGRYRQYTHDTAYDDLFVSLVKDELCFDQIRATAYQRLFEIRGLSVPEDLITLVCSGLFRFPDDVDWSFVATFDEK